MKRMLCAALLCSGAVTAGWGAEAGREALRVCADPDNLPFSNDKLEGFENRIAQIVADDLRLKVEYTWWPQRNSFLRQTLNAKQCDVVMGVPEGWEPVLATRPYYASTYVFVYRAKGKRTLASFDDPALRHMKIGLHAYGNDGVNLPPAQALARRGLAANVVGFSLFSSEDNAPGTIIDAVAKGEIGAAVVWGPLGGYFAKREKAPLRVTPVTWSGDASVRFVYRIAMGVRRADKEWKEQLDGVLERRGEEIRRVLKEAGVPLVEAGEGPTAQAAMQSMKAN